MVGHCGQRMVNIDIDIKKYIHDRIFDFDSLNRSIKDMYKEILVIFDITSI